MKACTVHLRYRKELRALRILMPSGEVVTAWPGLECHYEGIPMVLCRVPELFKEGLFAADPRADAWCNPKAGWQMTEPVTGARVSTLEFHATKSKAMVSGFRLCNASGGVDAVERAIFSYSRLGKFPKGEAT